MVYLLLQNRRNEFTRQSRLVYRLIVLTVNTGFWTAVLALIDLVLIAVFPSGSHFCVVDFPISALYVNALLANLNARHFLHRTDMQYSSNVDEMGVNAFALRDITSSAGTGTTVKDAGSQVVLRIGAPSSKRSLDPGAKAICTI
ncbi:hypothetical protein C2E23DRAFT_544715 [Lenzites betulinus]|nr:hypothetical protein C2E23DRAFT_544715 [Lenzites betulinus]